MLLTLMGRECPELPAEVLFSDIEIHILNATLIKLTDSLLLDDAVRAVAKLGGYIGRKNDSPPGHQIMRRGYTTLQIMCMWAEIVVGSSG